MAPIVVEYAQLSPLTIGIIIVSIVIIAWAYRRSDRDFELIEDEAGLEAISKPE
jgi:hypothetical protein